MRKVNTLIIIAFACILVSACNCKKEISKTQEQRNVIIEKPDASSIKDSSDILSFSIDTAWIANKVLFVNISYIGENSDVVFNLKWNGLLMKSLPPKAILEIEESHTNISGKKSVKQNLSFDLNPIFSTQNYDKIIFNLKKYKGRLQ